MTKYRIPCRGLNGNNPVSWGKMPYLAELNIVRQIIWRPVHNMYDIPEQLLNGRWRQIPHKLLLK